MKRTAEELEDGKGTCWLVQSQSEECEGEDNTPTIIGACRSKGKAERLQWKTRRSELLRIINWILVETPQKKSSIPPHTISEHAGNFPKLPWYANKYLSWVKKEGAEDEYVYILNDVATDALDYDSAFLEDLEMMAYSIDSDNYAVMVSITKIPFHDK